jgi:hypothetical protein
MSKKWVLGYLGGYPCFWWFSLISGFLWISLILWVFWIFFLNECMYEWMIWFDFDLILFCFVFRLKNFFSIGVWCSVLGSMDDFILFWIWCIWMYEFVVYIYRYIYICVFFCDPPKDVAICVYMCVECVYLCVVVCNCVVFCVNMCQLVSYCVVLCVFPVCIVCIVCICTYFRVPNCGVCISTSQIEVQFRVPNELFIKVSVSGCAEWGGVQMYVFGGVSIWGYSVSICVNMCVFLCVFLCVLCVLCVFVCICVWNGVNSCRNVWNVVFCVTFCEFYGNA